MDKITPKHFLFLIIGTAVVSLKTYPTTYLKDGLRDSWIAMILASILIFVIFVFVIHTWNKHKHVDFITIYKTALGNVLGSLFIYLFMATLLLTLVECGTMEADSMHQNVLIRTPHWYFLLFFIVPALYTIRKDLIAVITVTIISISLIMISGINLGVLTLPNKKWDLLFPLFENGITSGFFICIVKMVGLYGCVFITLPYLSKIKDTKNKMMKYAFIGLLIVIQMQIFSVMGLIMTFGPKWLNSINYPKLNQTQLISFFQFLDFGELYVMLQIVGGWLIKYILTFYAFLLLLRKLRPRSKSMNLLPIMISALVFIAATFASRDLFVLFRLLNYLEYIYLVNYVVVPLLVFILFNIRVKKMNLEDFEE